MASQLRALAIDIKLTHTVFALPFALLGMLLAAGWDEQGRETARVSGRLPDVIEIGLILFCMVSARTYAMAVNRWADAQLDAANPRTAGRAIPAGRMSHAFARGVIAVTGLGFVLITSGFWLHDGNAWPMILSLPVLGVLAGYSFAKRWTWLCHLILGGALAISPVAAALAIEPGYVVATATPWLLAAMVLSWVAGFDVIYALQDVAVDRELGLHSMPASLGVKPALWISRLLHVVSFACLLLAAWASPQLGVLFIFTAGLAGALLLLEHALIWRSSTRRIHLAFFTLNGIISLLLGAAGAVDVLIRL